MPEAEDDQRWRSVLRDAVPAAPYDPLRGYRARVGAERRRRRTVTGLVAAVVLVVAAVAGVPAALSDGPQAPGPARTPDVPAAAAPDADRDFDPRNPDCPPPPTDYSEWDLGGSATVEEVRAGAVDVLLCRGPYPSDLQEPADALRAGVDELASVVNALPVSGTPGVCTAMGGVGYQLVFRHPDDSTQVVIGQLGGCQLLSVGETLRERPAVALDAFTDLLRRQRAAGGSADAARGGPDCENRSEIRESWFSQVAGVADADSSRVVLCAWDGARAGPADQRIAVPAADAALLLADRKARIRRGDGPSGPQCQDLPSLSLAAVTPWGDHVVVRGHCGVFTEYDATSDTMLQWRPGAQARAVVDRLVARAGASS